MGITSLLKKSIMRCTVMTCTPLCCAAALDLGFHLRVRGRRLAGQPGELIGDLPAVFLYKRRISDGERFVFVLFAQRQPNAQGRDDGHRRNDLADAEAADHQAVGAQALHKEALRAVPHHIHQDQLAVEFAALHICPQQEKAQQAPDGFIQKRRVHRQGTADFMFKIFLHIYIFKSISVLFQTFCIRLKRKLPHIPFTAASMYQFLPE